MPIVLPNLDDRRWQDLVDEGRSLIPTYSTEWTNFNPSDPGITLMELFAFIAEMDIYQLNRIPDRHKRKFLELIGLVPHDPKPAFAVLSFAIASGQPPQRIAAGTEYRFTQSNLWMRTVDAVTVAPGTFSYTQTGGALVLTFTDPLPAGRQIGLYIDVPAGQRSSLTLIWEYRNGQGWWSPLKVVDGTCELARDGEVSVTGPAKMRAPYSIRIRTESGAALDVQSILLNAVRAEQAHIQDSIALPVGTGAPDQIIKLPRAPLLAESLVLSGNGPWEARTSLDASTPADAHFVLDPQTGLVSFGDGRRGRVPAFDEKLTATYLATAAGEATITVGDTAVNTGSLVVKTALVTAPGADAETLAQALDRAVAEREAPLRAVTLTDYEALAKATPGTDLARVSAKANVHPAMECVNAFGVVTVIVVPNIAGPTPRPDAALRKKIRTYLDARRMIGTRVEVTGPVYLEVAVQATVKAFTGQNRARLTQSIIAALNAFFDPLAGGPDAAGWPFGRDVYRLEVLQKIAATPGVDHVISMDLIPAGCDPQCGNICLKPTWLVTPGSHQIEVQ
jgi:hypothetical protein